MRNASRLADENDISAQTRFEVADVSSIPDFDADIVISLGLLDWLDEGQLNFLFKAAGRADFLHSFSEKRLSIQQLAHRIYVQMSYGWRTRGYVPRYYSEDLILGFARRHNERNINTYRHRRLSFGTIVTTLPLPRP